MSYCLERPKRIHAVDLNPAQNHLLELKVAAFRSLEYQEVWKLFGDGKHDDFQRLLLDHLSPHLSSQAFDYWLHVGPSTFSPSGNGLYYTGGSRHALRLVSVCVKSKLAVLQVAATSPMIALLHHVAEMQQIAVFFFRSRLSPCTRSDSQQVAWLGSLLGVRNDMRRLCEAQTMNEQREIWQKRVRRVLLSQLLAYFVVGSERFLWKALGVPGEQRAMIEEDYKRQTDREASVHSSAPDAASGVGRPGDIGATRSGQAIWNYGVQTLDPVVNSTLVSEDNHYYLLCLLGESA